MTFEVKRSGEVATAQRDGVPIVAMESTIYSNLGLPSPANREALDRCSKAIRGGGCVPAVVVVLDGVVRLGVEPHEEDRLLGEARKVAERDIAVAVAQRWSVGVTTVSATVSVCAVAGVSVFATGGIGGVHRQSEVTGDISADLDAIASHPVITVSAGAKAFLDLPRTLEYFETIGVPVVGWQHDWFPAFYTRSSGIRLTHRAESGREVAMILANRSRPNRGVLVANPIPAADELDAVFLDGVLSRAVSDCAKRGISGAAVTPFILGRIAEATEGRSVPANLALAENNARVAAEIARAVAELR